MNLSICAPNNFVGNFMTSEQSAWRHRKVLSCIVYHTAATNCVQYVNMVDWVRKLSVYNQPASSTDNLHAEQDIAYTENHAHMEQHMRIETTQTKIISSMIAHFQHFLNIGRRTPDRNVANFILLHFAGWHTKYILYCRMRAEITPLLQL